MKRRFVVRPSSLALGLYRPRAGYFGRYTTVYPICSTAA